MCRTTSDLRGCRQDLTRPQVTCTCGAPRAPEGRGRQEVARGALLRMPAIQSSHLWCLTETRNQRRTQCSVLSDPGDIPSTSCVRIRWSKASSSTLLSSDRDDAHLTRGWPLSSAFEGGGHLTRAETPRTFSCNGIDGRNGKNGSYRCIYDIYVIRTKAQANHPSRIHRRPDFA